MERVTWSHNLHTVYMRGEQPVGIECETCQHRAVVTSQQIGGQKGDMTRILDVKLKCTRCGSRKFGAVLFNVEGEAETWRAGGRPPPSIS